MCLFESSSQPVCAQSLCINKSSGSMSLTRFGDNVELDLLCPGVFVDDKFIFTKSAADVFLRKLFGWKKDECTLKKLFGSLPANWENCLVLREFPIPQFLSLCASSCFLWAVLEHIIMRLFVWHFCSNTTLDLVMTPSVTPTILYCLLIPPLTPILFLGEKLGCLFKEQKN